MTGKLVEALFNSLYAAAFIFTAWLASVLLYAGFWYRLYCVVPFVLWTLTRYDGER